MTPSVTLVRLFDRSWADWLRGVESCRRKPTRRAVHAFRVTCRRLEALTEVLEHTTEAPPKRLRWLREAAAEALAALSPLRDDQVHRRRIEKAGDGRAFHALLDDVRRRQARHRKRARRRLGHIDLARADRAAARVRRAVVGGQGAHTPHERRTRLLTAIAGAREDVRRRLTRTDPDRSRTLHTLRVAIKRCRYVTEIAEEVAPGIGVPAQPALRALQRRLGTVHDADVLARRVATFASRHREHRKDLRRFRTRIAVTRARGVRGLTHALPDLRDALAGPVARVSSGTTAHPH